MPTTPQFPDRDQTDVRELTADEILSVGGAGGEDPFPVIHR